MNKEKTIGFRCNEKVYSDLKWLSALEGRTMSDYIFRLIEQSLSEKAIPKKPKGFKSSF